MTQAHSSYIYPIDLALRPLPEDISVDSLLETFGIRQAFGHGVHSVLGLNILSQQKAGYNYAKAPASLALYLQDCTNPQERPFCISDYWIEDGTHVYGKRRKKKAVKNLYIKGSINGKPFQATDRLCRLPDEGLRSTLVGRLKGAFPEELGPVLFRTQELISLYGTGSVACCRTSFHFYDGKHGQSWDVQGVGKDPISSAVKALSDGFRIALDPRRQSLGACPTQHL